MSTDDMSTDSSSIEDSDAWLNALAGRADATDVGAEPEVHEARALRNFMQANLMQEMANAEDESQVPFVDASREAALIARARAAGVLPVTSAPASSAPAFTGATSASPTFTNGWRWWLQRLTAPRAALAFAAVVALAVLGGRVLLFAPPTETLRGAEHGVVRLQSADPHALKQQITAELTHAGIHVTGYERLERVGIDADLPLPVSPAVQLVLARHRIPVPGDGVLTVEFDRPGAP